MPHTQRRRRPQLLPPGVTRVGDARPQLPPGVVRVGDVEPALPPGVTRVGDVESPESELTRAQQRAQLGVPEDPGNIAVQAGRGFVLGAKGALGFARDVGSAALAVPRVISRSLGFEGRDIGRATRGGFAEGATELPRALLSGDVKARELAGFQEGLTPIEQAGKIGFDVAMFAATRKIPGPGAVLRGVRQTRAARAAAPGIVQRSVPPTPISRQLAAAPDDIVRMLEQRAIAEANAGRVVAQEAADRSLAAQRAAGQPGRPLAPPVALRRAPSGPLRVEPAQVVLPFNQAGRPPTTPPGAAGVVPGGAPSPAARVAPTPSGTAPGRAPALPEVIPDAVPPVGRGPFELAPGLGIDADAALSGGLRGVTPIRGVVPRGTPSGPVTAPGIPEGPIRRGMTATEPTSGTVIKVIDIRPNGQLLVSNVGEATGTRTPSRFVPADSLINFTKPRRGDARAFKQTGVPIQTIQDVKGGFGSESGRARLGPLAVVGAGGAGAAAGAAFGEPGDELINALIGGTAGAGAALGALRGVRPRTAPRRAPGQPTGRQRLIQGGLDVRREIFLSGLAGPQNFIAANTVLPRAALLTGSLAPLRGVPRMLLETTRAALAPKSTLRRRGLRDIRLEETRRNVGPISQRIGAIDAVAEAELRARVPGITQEQINALLVKTPLSTTIGRGNMLSLLKSQPGQAAFPFQRTAADITTGGFHDLRQLLAGGRVQGQLGSTTRNRLLTAGNVAAGAALGETLEPDLQGLTAFLLLKAILGRGAVPLAAGAIATGGRQFGRGLIPAPDVALDVGQFLPTRPEDIGAVRVFNQLRGRR